MANRSQHPWQIMEPQARFDLNAAIENWRQELTTQPGLTPDIRRELETHLRDSIAGFLQHGLNEDESFWLARRRVGQPHQLVNEFAKANPAVVWRERVFWMALACLAICCWTSLVSCIPLHNWSNGLIGLLSAFAWVLLLYVPLVLLAIPLAKGQFCGRYHLVTAFFKSRGRFVLGAGVLLLATHGYQLLADYRFRIQTDHGRLPHTLDGMWVNEFSYICWPVLLIALVAWLLPPQKQKSLKPA
jgi:hypothetical protein